MDVRSVGIVEKLKSGELKPAALVLELVGKVQSFDPTKKEEVLSKICKELFEALEGSEVDLKDVLKGIVGHLLDVAGTVKATEKRVSEATTSFFCNLLCRPPAIG